MEQIKETINDYIKAKNTDYAIMLNGEWGCGKTYFINHSVIKDIEQIESEVPDAKSGQNIKYKPLYISLYGLSNIKQIHSKIVSLSYPIPQNRLTNILTKGAKIVLEKTLDVNSDDYDLLISLVDIPLQSVLIFDDLERISSNLELKEVLGSINQYAEHKGLKVLIICNDDKADSAFKDFKEKTVRFSLKFETDIRTVFDSITEKFSSPYKDFLDTHKAIIIQIFDVAQYKNLRTLKFILELFEKIYDIIPKVEYQDVILKDFIFFITLYSIEYKIGKSRDELSTLINMENYFSIDLMDSLLSNNDNKVKVEKNEPSFLEMTSEKYDTIRDKFHFHEPLAAYIQNGFVDLEGFVLYVKEQNEKISKSEMSDEYKLLQKFNTLEEIEVDEFEDMYSQILAGVKEAKFSLYEYPTIYARLVVLEFNKITGCEITPEITQLFKDAIDANKSAHKYNFTFDHRILNWDINDTSGCREKYMEIFNYAIEANEYAGLQEHNSSLNKFTTAIENNDVDSISEFMSNYHNRSIFDELSAGSIFEKLINSNAKTRLEFLRGLYAFYPDNLTNPSVTEKTSNFFSQLSVKIDDYFQSNSKDIGYIIFSRISRKCKSISLIPRS